MTNNCQNCNTVFASRYIKKYCEKCRKGSIYRKHTVRTCKNCKKDFPLIEFAYRIYRSKEYCTGICNNCHPDLNTKCCKCLILKSNTRFHSHQLLRYEKSECKTCSPRLYSERQMASRKAYCLRPENRKRATELAKRRNKERRETDIQFRLKWNLRGRLYNFVKGKTKVGSAVKDLGCTVEELKIHLEDQFKPGMSWENYGNKPDQWSIDHILPMSKFDLTNRKQLLICCNYKNLQPMWHLENISKGNKSNL